MASSRSSSSPRPPSPLHPVSSLAPRSPFRHPPRRSTSPSLSALPKHLQPLTKRLEGNDAEAETRVSAGTLSEAEYERLLPKWRVWVRRKLVRSLEREMPYLEWMQVSGSIRGTGRELRRLRGQKTLRTPRRDVYFVQSSLLGTHSAFLIFLPMTFWFGGGETGRGCVGLLRELWGEVLTRVPQIALRPGSWYAACCALQALSELTDALCNRWLRDLRSKGLLLRPTTVRSSSPSPFRRQPLAGVWLPLDSFDQFRFFGALFRRTSDALESRAHGAQCGDPCRAVPFRFDDHVRTSLHGNGALFSAPAT